MRINSTFGVTMALATLLSFGSLLEAKADLSQYNATDVVTSYVSGNSPTMILSFDNNLEVCLALRTPGTLDELREQGIEVTRSQALVLRLWALLETGDDGTLRFTLPVVDGPRADELSKLADSLAQDVVSATSEALDTFRRVVSDAGWARSEYALLGSYVLDGVVWTAIEAEGILRDADATSYESGSEYWSGVSWVTLAEVSKDLGTNSGARDRGTMHVAWAPPTLEIQAPLWRSGRSEVIIELARGESGVDPETVEALRQMGLIDSQGRTLYPVIDAGSPICERGGELARGIARQLVQSANALSLLGCAIPLAWLWDELDQRCCLVQRLKTQIGHSSSHLL